jgi:NAD(P)H-dependent FMN reductase
MSNIGGGASWHRVGCGCFIIGRGGRSGYILAENACRLNTVWLDLNVMGSDRCLPVETDSLTRAPGQTRIAHLSAA